MQSTSTSTSTRHLQLAAEIHKRTAIPLAPAGLAAACAFGAPDELLGRFKILPHILYQRIASYLALPPGDRLPAHVLNSRSGLQVPVNVLGMSGFDVTVDVGGNIYGFDATSGEFCLGINHSTATARVAVRKQLCDTRTMENEKLFGKSIATLDTNVGRVRALLAIPPDLRPQVVIHDRRGAPTMARLIDERRGHVLLEIAAWQPVVTCAFDLRMGQLNFEVSDADPAAHARYTAAMGSVGMPFPLHDKA